MSRSLNLWPYSYHGPCVPVSVFVPAHAPVLILDPVLVSLSPCVLVPRPLSPPFHSVIFCSTSTPDPPSSDNSLVSQLRLKEATILVTLVETLVTLRPPIC